MDQKVGTILIESLQKVVEDSCAKDGKNNFLQIPKEVEPQTFLYHAEKMIACFKNVCELTNNEQFSPGDKVEFRRFGTILFGHVVNSAGCPNECVRIVCDENDFWIIPSKDIIKI